MKPSSVLSGFRRRSTFAATALLATLLVPVLTSPTAMAFGGGSGNPFGNGSYFPNDGTFQATIRGVNLSGVAIFSTSSDGSGGGTFTVFANGNTYIGNTSGAIDGGKISATFEASIPGSGHGTSTSTIASTFGLISSTETDTGPTSTTTVSTSGGDILTFPSVGSVTIVSTDQVVTVSSNGSISQQPISPPLPGLGTTTTSTTDTQATKDTTSTYGLIKTVANSTYNDVLYAGGSFTANLFNSFPNQQFKGNGSMIFQDVSTIGAVPQLISNRVPISVDGIRTSDTTGTFTPVTVDHPTVFTTFEVTP